MKKIFRTFVIILAGLFTFCLQPKTNDHQNFAPRTLNYSFGGKVYFSKGEGVGDIWLYVKDQYTTRYPSGTWFEINTRIEIYVTILPGYTFDKNWTNYTHTNRGGWKIWLNDDFVVNSNRDLGAISAPRAENTITLNANGGTNGATTSVTATPGSAMPAIPSANLPKRTGYTFTGFYDATSGGTQYYTSSGASARNWDKTSDTTLYARWSANTYKVQYNGNKPSSTSGSVSKVPSAATWTYNSNATLGAAPTLTGYTFSGWFKEASCTNKVGNASQTLTKPNLTATKNATVNLYAKWTPNKYTVKFNSNIPAISVSTVSNMPSDASWTYDANPKLPAAPTLAGYTFAGWYKEASCTNKVGNAGQTLTKPNLTATNNGTVTLYAKWTYNSEIQNVIDLIDDIGGKNNVEYSASKEDIEAAESAYDVLIASHPEYADLLAAKHDELVEDRNQYENLRTLTIQALNAELENLLNEDGDVEVTYPDSHDNLFEAEALYNTLEECDKTSEKVPDIEKLGAIRDEYNTQRDAAVQAVIDAIDNIYRDNDGNIVYIDSKESLVAAEELYDALAPEEKAPSTAVSNYADLVQARTDYNALIGDRTSQVVNAINNISKPFDENYKSQLQTANELYDSLDETEKNSAYITNLQILNDANAASDVVDMIEALRDYENFESQQAFIDAVDAALEAYNTLSFEQKSYLNDSQRTLLSGMDDAAIIIRGIDKMGNVVTYDNNDHDSKADIDFYQHLYDQLPDELFKDVVDHFNKSILDHNAEVYNNVDSVASLIRALTPAEDQAYYDAVDAAKTAYDALTDEEKGVIDAATDFDYEKSLADNVAAKDVIERIDDIDSVTYDNGIEDSLADIAYAEEGYNALTDDQKAIVDAINHATLTHDREVYDNVDEVADLIRAITPAEDQAYYDAVDAAKAAYDALTDEEKGILNASVDLDYDKTLADNVAAKEVIKRIDDIDDVTYDGGENDSLADITYAEEGYNDLTDDQKAIVDSVNHATLTHDREVYDNVEEVASLIEAIPLPAEDQAYYDAVDAAKAGYDALTDEEKAIIDTAINFDYEKVLTDNVAAKDVIKRIDDIDDVTYDGGENDSLADITYAEEGYEALTDEQKAIVDSVNHDTLTHDREVYDNVDEVADLIRDLTPAEDQEYYDAVDAAKAAYDALTDEEKGVIDAALDFDYEKVLEDNVQASETIQKIGEIGTITYNQGNQDSLDLIIAAEESYDSLTDDQKAIVDAVNHDTLKQDRESYDKVDEAVNLIQDIGEVSYGGEEDSQEAIQAAREAFNALGEDEQALVEGYQESYKKLEDDEHVYSAMEYIDNIGNVEFDSESGEKIQEAREYYDSLTDDQKAQLGESQLETLTQSETNYSDMKKTGNVVLIISYVVAGVIIIGGLWFLFFICRKKNKKDDQRANFR